MTRPRARIRPVTVILVLAILVLGVLVTVQQRREARLRQALAPFRNRAHQSIYKRLDGPSPPMGTSPRLSLNWGATAPLEEVISQLKLFTNRRTTRLRSSFPIEVDFAGLAESGQSLTSLVRLPPEPSQILSLDEFMHHVLEPMNLDFEIRDGALFITSHVAVERSHDRILKFLDQPVLLTWPDGASLDDVIAAVRSSTMGPEFPLGLPMYPDPSSVDDSDLKTVVAPAPKQSVPVWEHLVRILSPLRMKFELRNGALVILSRPRREE